MLGRIAYFAAQRVMTCDVWHLLLLDSAGVKRPTCDERFSFRFLSVDEVSAFSRDPANHLDPSFSERMLFGLDLCMAALDGDRLAAYAWYALGSLEAEHNRSADPNSGVDISFAPDTTFAYNAFTRPEYRGRRLQSIGARRALDALAARGITRLLAATDCCNRSSLRCCAATGFRDLGQVWRLGWGKAAITWTPPKAKEFGIRFGSEAQVHQRGAGSPPVASRPLLQSVRKRGSEWRTAAPEILAARQSVTAFRLRA